MAKLITHLAMTAAIGLGAYWANTLLHTGSPDYVQGLTIGSMVGWFCGSWWSCREEVPRG